MQHVRVCVSYACRHHEVAGFEPWEWELVVQKMHPEQNDSPELERDRISKTVGLMEEIIGPKVGTQYNKARNRPGPKGTRQLDCIAETVNTTIYLTLLEDEHLLLYHQVAGPAKRGPMNLTFWHYSAVVKETIPGRRFAVDPWFNDNGHPATVVPLDEWLSGYSPD
ncbi:hypothetical protein [Desulfonatronovibrio hydrogenovorans]|uniref:hypothetical protein n=1 Tax=Desulfonatronovibrio hydrogenovorans TaxID=53245 RepID=UPI00123715F6|nr:hypothetical protein [Desulfonatronovibrio hydrogenovorans]